MFNFKEYREYYRDTLKLAAPIVLSQIGYITVQLVDNAMVGRLGKENLAAVSFGGTVFYLVFIFVIGIAMGLTPLVGRQFAQSNHRVLARYLQNGLVLYSIIGVIASLILHSMIPLMYHMGQPEVVVDMAIPFFRYLALSIIPFAIFLTFKQFLEGIGRTSMNMTVIICSNVVNIICNYIFIYGNWGAPAMGIDGAGVAALIARGSMPIILVLYFVSKPQLRKYFKFFSWSEIQLKWSRLLLSIGLPISLQMFMEGSAFALTAIMMGWIGTVAIGAHQIANVIASFAFMIVVGIAAATTIRVSHEYGRGNLVALKKVATSSYHISIMWNCFTATVFILFRNQIPLIFTNDPEVVALASKLMLFVAAFQFSDGLQLISIGVLRGLQDVKSITRVALFSYIIINLPLGYFCAFILGWGAEGLWFAFIFGLSTAAILLSRRYRSRYQILINEQIGSPQENVVEIEK